MNDDGAGPWTIDSTSETKEGKTTTSMYFVRRTILLPRYVAIDCLEHGRLERQTQITVSFETKIVVHDGRAPSSRENYFDDMTCYITIDLLLL
jgi:hypothetical protein